jgi:hypothetical protein
MLSISRWWSWNVSGWFDAVHVEHADAPIADPQRQRQRRGDVPVVLEVLHELLGLAGLVDHTDSPFSATHPAMPSADALASVARELRLEPVGRPCLQLARSSGL